MKEVNYSKILLAVIPVIAPQDRTQDVIGFYQVLASQISQYTNTMTVLATIFAVIIAIVLAFFTLRQISVEKEIQLYKEDIKKQRDTLRIETDAIKKDLISSAEWVKSKKSEIEKALEKPLSTQTKSDLEKLKKKVDSLQEEVAFKRGIVSVPTGPFGGSYLSSMQVSTSSINDPHIYSGYLKSTDPFSLTYSKTCNKCGKSYNEVASITSISSCPHCGNIN